MNSHNVLHCLQWSVNNLDGFDLIRGDVNFLDWDVWAEFDVAACLECGEVFDCDILFWNVECWDCSEFCVYCSCHVRVCRLGLW